VGSTFTYKNPIYTDAFDSIRDAQITVVGGVYYLTGSLPPYWEGLSPGVKLFQSADLKQWEFAADLIRRDDVPGAAWYKDRFWAPEIHHRGGRFYLTFGAKNEAKGTDFGMAILVANEIAGPYRMLTEEAPLAVGRGIDLSLMTDDDGKTYGFWTSGEWLQVAELDLDRAAPLTGPARCVTMVPGTWEDRVIEGPYCIKRDGVYYLFYSCGARGYEVGYATAPSPFGPWTKGANNPLFGVQNQEACDKMGIAFTGDPDHPLFFAGHNSIFPGPDGRDWTSYLVQEKGKPEQMGIDPIWIEDGTVKTTAPTWSRQTVPLPGE